MPCCYCSCSQGQKPGVLSQTRNPTIFPDETLAVLVQNWGLEITMFSLLVAAFLATNILSLLYMGMIAVGMGVKPGPRRRAWRFFFVPTLGLILLFQYSVLIG